MHSGKAFSGVGQSADAGALPNDQMRPNWGAQKQDFVKCLKINNLQSLVVPRAGAKMLVTGGDYCVFIGGY